MNIAEIKAYQEKIDAQLHEAKALLSGFEAHAKGKLAQSELDTISRLKAAPFAPWICGRSGRAPATSGS